MIGVVDTSYVVVWESYLAIDDDEESVMSYGWSSVVVEEALDAGCDSVVPVDGSYDELGCSERSN